MHCPSFGEQASVETFSYQTSWFVDACFPAAATRRAIAPAGSARRGAAGAVQVECRDKGGVRVNGVLYGRACAENAPCGRAQHLVPAPQSCGWQLANQSSLALSTDPAHVGALRNAAAKQKKAAQAYEKMLARPGLSGIASITISDLICCTECRAPKPSLTHRNHRASSLL